LDVFCSKGITWAIEGGGMKKSKRIRKVRVKEKTKSQNELELFKESEVGLRKDKVINLEEYQFSNIQISESEKKIIVYRGLGFSYEKISKILSVSKSTISKVVSRYSDDVKNIKLRSVQEVSESLGVTRVNLSIFNSFVISKLGASIEKDILDGNALEKMPFEKKLKLLRELEDKHNAFYEENKIQTGELENLFKGPGILKEDDVDT
jgi:transcriptional regulator with XRE-family HTH domain